MSAASAKVLFVDDETPFLDTLLKRLRKRGMDVHGVDCGDRALAYMDGHPVDVVVLDVRMPGLDGFGVLTEIKRRWPLTEVILLTGHACISSAVDMMSKGAFDYLTKPVEIQGLIFRIEDAFGKKQLAAGRPESRPENQSLKADG